MIKLAVIGGTGMTSLKGLAIVRREVVSTQWGEPSGPITHGTLCGKPIVFLPRHGSAHTIPPHKVNYRANVWALKQLGIERIIAVAAVGGIHAEFAPARIAVPAQIIDYTWSRGHTFFENELRQVVHVDFTEPYCPELRNLLVAAAGDAGVDALDWGTYGASQGPRLETAAEIDRMERDGCQMVGMTGMPEAVLAREAGLRYAHCTVITNPAAGRGGRIIRMEDMKAALEAGMENVHRLLESLMPLLS
jgi:5'-deoxy-5'-methylthioadenosine phosphorylase